MGDWVSEMEWVRGNGWEGECEGMGEKVSKSEGVDEREY